MATLANNSTVKFSDQEEYRSSGVSAARWLRLQEFRRILNPGQTEVLATGREQGFQAPTELRSVALLQEGFESPSVGEASAIERLEDSVGVASAKHLLLQLLDSELLSI